MRSIFLISAMLCGSMSFADLATDCAVTDRTACVFNSGANFAEFLVYLPNYTYCGVKFMSDTVPDEALWDAFAQELYVTVGPRWDMLEYPVAAFEDNLEYPFGTRKLFATFFSVYTRTGETLADYAHRKLATEYNSTPTVTLIGKLCE